MNRAARTLLTMEVRTTSHNPRQHQSKRQIPGPFRSGARKGKLSGSIIAISSAAIISVYALGRTNTSAAFGQLNAAAPAASAPVTPASNGGSPAATPAATYRDGTYTGSGTSRKGGMQVKVVIKDGKIASANVTSCGTRYPCSDVDPLIRAAVSKQSVPANYVSGATESSKAYKQALTAALQQAKA
jgi:uncharacterized protein with FMN-binding domain